MKKPWPVVIAALACCTIIISCSSACTADPYSLLPGTIAHAMQMPDGAGVTLPGVLVTKTVVRPPYIVVREPWPDESRLIVLLPGPLDVSMWQTVDVSGIMTTLINGYRAVTYARIFAHYDAWGNVIKFPAPFKGLPDAENPFSQREELTVQSAAPASSPSMTILTEDPPVPPGDPPQGTLPVPVPGPLALPDGAYVKLSSRVVTAVFSDHFYIQESDRAWGIRVRCSDSWPSAGDVVTVEGMMATVGGQREIAAATWTSVDTEYPLPRPFYIRGCFAGGGSLGDFTPAIGASRGLHNTGLVVSLTGKVTQQDYLGYYTVQDGSQYSDLTLATVKVYDDLNYPLADDYVGPLVGIVGAEIPQGESVSIPVLHALNGYTPGGFGGDTGSITVTVQATGADGKAVRIYGTPGSAASVFASGSAAHTFSTVRYGTHVVSAGLPGYATATAKVVVDAAHQTPSVVLTLTAAETHIIVSASPERIAPDGASTSTITARVLDDEGRPLGTGDISFQTDLGMLISTDAQTDEYGYARATLRSSTEHEVATVWATSPNATAGGVYVEFADPEDPIVIITQPSWNQQVGGLVAVEALASDIGGVSPGIARIRLLVDGMDEGPYAQESTAFLDTRILENGSHVLQMAATDFDDNVQLSNRVPFTTSNAFAGLRADKQELLTPDENAHITSQSGPQAWSLSIINHQKTLVYSTTGGGPVDVIWGNGASEGLYEVQLIPQTDPPAQAVPSRLVLTVQSHLYNADAVIGGNPDSWFQTSVLDPVSHDGEVFWDGVIQEMGAAFDACRSVGLTCALLWRPSWTGADARIPNRVSLRDLLANGASRVFFYTGHGKVDHIPSSWTIDTFVRDVTQVHFIDEDVLALESFLKPSRRTYQNSFEDCGLADSGRLKLIQVSSCYSLTDQDTPYNPFNPTREPGHTTQIGDLGIALGVASYSNYIMMDQTYGGFNNEYKPGPYNGGTELHQHWWAWLRRGATALQALGFAGSETGYPPAFDYWRFVGYPELTWLY